MTLLQALRVSRSLSSCLLRSVRVSRDPPSDNVEGVPNPGAFVRVQVKRICVLKVVTVIETRPLDTLTADFFERQGGSRLAHRRGGHWGLAQVGCTSPNRRYSTLLIDEESCHLGLSLGCGWGLGLGVG